MGRIGIKLPPGKERYHPKILTNTEIHLVLFSIKKSLKAPKNTVVNHLNVIKTFVSPSSGLANSQIMLRCLIKGTQVYSTDFILVHTMQNVEVS